MTKSKNLNTQQFRSWIEEKGAICRVEKVRLQCVIDIDHIEPGNFAALYAVPAPPGLHIIELAEYFPSEAAAWEALQDDSSPAHPAAPVLEWIKEQYLTDKSARVERLLIESH
ncbi:MAG: hypothetical protein GYA34_16900 [Chloroflexi bacterium]|nr:hypothetical protein [Chloroflexota bacterium]